MLVPKDDDEETSVVSRSLASDGDVMMMVGTAAAELEGGVASSSAGKSLQEKEVVRDDIISELTSKISQGSNQEKMALTSQARGADSRKRREPRRRGGPTKMRGSRLRDCRHCQRLPVTMEEIEANLEISDSGASEDSSASTMVVSFCLCSGPTKAVAAAVSFSSAMAARESRGSAEAKIIGGWEPSSSKSISASSRSSWLVRKSPSGLR
jgi:hypothetical protein